MARWNGYLIAGLSVLVLCGTNAAEDESEPGTRASAEISASRVTSLISGLAGSAFQSGGANRPKLYDSTSRCTVNVQALAVGGSTFPNNPLSILDYFETQGGTMSGFDLYLLNGGGDPDVGGGPQPISEFKFYAGSDSTQIGTPIPGAFFRTPNQGGRALSPVPVHVDADGVPLMIKVSVDYDAGTYNVTDAATGTPLIDDETGFAIVDQDIGARRRITLPAGKAGVLLRLGGEWSVCASSGGVLGDPQAGPVLAGGGSGADDGFYIINAERCPGGLHETLCDNRGWDPGSPQNPTPTPCSGGNVCSLNRPFNGIMMTFFMGPSEEGDGDNTAATAQLLDVGSPGELAPDMLCVSELVTVNGFLGNNSQPSVIFNALCFDGAPAPEGDEFIDLLDWGKMQLCFGQDGGSGCATFDADNSGAVDLDDYETFQECLGTPPPGAPCYSCAGFGPPILLADVDIYKITNVSRGDVFEVLVEGTKSPVTGSLWDPFLRIWGETPSGLVLMETSDNYGRVNTDAFTTVKIPRQGTPTALYIGVSASENKNYEPDDATTIESLCPDGQPDPLKRCASRAGGYSLTVGVVDPECIEIDPPQRCNNDQGERYDTGIHEPDDTLEEADEQGALVEGEFIVFGVIGDGAFSAYGQDVDIYKVVLNGQLAGVRRLTALMPGIAGRGFRSVFDMAIGLYDSRGVLLGAGDQKSTSGQFPPPDQSRPQMAATVCGTAVSNCPLRFADGQEQDGVYYIAVFGTDRGIYVGCDEDRNAIAVFPAIPPTRLSFPHDPEVARTQNTDLRPTVGGRVNLPGPPLQGPHPLNCELPPQKHQCYRLNILTSNSPLVNQQGFDECEGGFDDETQAVETDDSVFDACEVTVHGSRLSESPIEKFWLGNGPYGGWQGDADFHRLSVEPGQIVSVSIADMQQPPISDHPVRSYLAFYDGCGNILATHDYSLERPWRTENGFDIGDGVRDEIAANITVIAPATLPVVPCSTPSSSDMYVMIGIDNGNMLMEENTPFDAAHPGTTLSRRFETKTWRQRKYSIGITVLDPVTSVDPAVRVFATPIRGLDGNHVSCFLRDNHPLNGSPTCWPPILELDPITGQTKQVLDGGEFFRTRRNAQGIFEFATNEFVSANPLLAYDGRHLWIAVESCAAGEITCDAVSRTLYKMDPDLRPGAFGQLELVGPIEGLDLLRSETATGMVEWNGFLYLLDNQNNEHCQEFETCYQLLWWDKNQMPLAGAVKRTIDLTELSGDGPDPKDEFDYVFGDLGVDDDGVIYMPCSFEGVIQGLCGFTHDLQTEFIDFVGIFTEPVSNLEDTDNDDIPDLTPGPRIGGFDFIGNNVMIASDANGPIIQYWDMDTDTVTGLALPREFIVHRISARVELD